MDASSIQDDLPWDSCKQVPKQVKIHSLEFQGWNPAVCFAPSSQGPELHHLMATTANSKHPNHLFLVYKD